MAEKNISVSAVGTTLEIEDLEVTPAYHDIGGIMSYNRAEVAPPVEDASTLQSTFKEKSIGLPDPGQISGTMQHNRADPGQAQMQTAKTNREKRNFRLTLSDGSVETGAGYVLDMPHEGSAGGTRVNGNFTIELTGEPVIS